MRVFKKNSGIIKLVIPSKCPYPRVGCGGGSLYVCVELKPLPSAIAAIVCYCMFFSLVWFRCWCVLVLTFFLPSRGRCSAACSPSIALLTVHPKQPCGEPEGTVP